ncbi:MAG: hypothetical protein NT002_01465 [candidate division Zixibacteria bacterium]|nr:hypothetical protein [candidate division Zixibacteria bacterium]
MKLKILIICSLLLPWLVPLANGQDSTGTTARPAQIAVQPPAPVGDLTARDSEDDNGHSISLSWSLSPDDAGGLKNVLGYKIFRAASKEGPFAERNVAASGINQYNDAGGSAEGDNDYMANNIDFYYKVQAITADSLVFADSPVFGPVQATGQWFNKARTTVLVFVICFMAVMLFFINKARSGADLFVRKLAGIEAVDEAIGRATEMGKPILYVLGLGTAADIATIASFTILGRVAKKVAEYQTRLIVPCNDPIVMSVAQETVRASYMDAGRPDAYKEDMVYFVTSLQFPYVAAVNGTMLRELPATNIYMGKFYAESLLLAETGALAGSIQIAGTDEIAQIPFFVVACDYTLIGEELYAASAYLGREPVLLGSLKAQDYAKAAVIVLSIIGIVAANVGWTRFVELFHITR